MPGSTTWQRRSGRERVQAERYRPIPASRSPRSGPIGPCVAALFTRISGCMREAPRRVFDHPYRRVGGEVDRAEGHPGPGMESGLQAMLHALQLVCVPGGEHERSPRGGERRGYLPAEPSGCPGDERGEARAGARPAGARSRASGSSATCAIGGVYARAKSRSRKGKSLAGAVVVLAAAASIVRRGQSCYTRWHKAADSRYGGSLWRHHPFPTFLALRVSAGWRSSRFRFFFSSSAQRLIPSRQKAWS